MELVIIVVLIVAGGIALAALAGQSATRWRALVRELVPRNRLGGRGLTWSVASGQLVVETELAPAGITYQAAVRSLSRGPILAMLDELKASASDTRLVARLKLAGMGAATLHARLRSIVALADALEALPIAEAMARAFVELPPETASAERLAAFESLIRWHPRAREVLGVCQTHARGGEDPTIMAKAKAHLALVSAEHRPSAA